MRFQGFTDEWKQTTLNEVADFIKERVNTSCLLDNYISTENLISNFGGVQTAMSIPSDTNVIRFKKGDVLVSNIRPYLRKVWFADKEGGCSADVFVFRAKGIEPSFLYNSIANDSFINYVMSGIKGVKMPRGDKQQMLKYPFFVPSIEEQRKISRLLSLLDERIATQSKIIDKLQSLIKGIDDKLLFNDAWATIRLCDILTERVEKSMTNNQHEVLSSTVKGLYSQREYFSKDIASENNVGYKIIRLHDIVLSPQNLWMGNINYNNRFDVGIVSPSYKIYKVSPKFDKYFIASILKTHRALYNYLLVSEQGASVVRRNLNMEAFEQLTFKIPSYNLQVKIGRALSLLQNQFDNALAIKQIYVRQKQYLLSQMFI